MKEGVHGKYKIAKTDGSELDSMACYFVLRLDKDRAARAAMHAYAAVTEDQKLASDIMACLDELEAPNCGCRSVGECYHGHFSKVWRIGDFRE